MAAINSPFSYKDRKNTKILRIRIALTMVIMLILFLVVTSLLISSIRIGSQSMEPSIRAGNSLFYFPSPSLSRLERGDIVVIAPPHFQENSFLVRLVNPLIRFISFQKLEITSWRRTSWEKDRQLCRIVALGGDSVYIKNNVAYIRQDGQEYALSEFETSLHEYDIQTSQDNLWQQELFQGNYEEILLNPGEYFVMGDNRGGASDSSYWGILTEDRIEGRAFITFWPLNQIKLH